MSRSVAWRRTCNDLVFWRQCQALEATIYILRETGPTGFLLKEDGEAKPVKVFLGDPHSCTCTTFMKDRDLCKHICWLILKKFRVQQNNPITWQLGLVEREINDILFGATVRQRKTPVRCWNTSGPPGATGITSDGRPTIQQREIGEDDCCPICQDELLLKHIPVTYCKFGCGNSIHIKCMKIWADHQKTSGEKTIKCPFCREDFGPIELLKQESRNAVGVPAGGRMDRHIATTCQSCHTSPIEGKCYRCTACPDYHLCQSCFNTPLHTNHPFEYRHKRNQRWRPAQRTYGAVLPEAVANDLLNRELTDSDYELLTQLDSSSTQQPSQIPEEVINTFPLEKVRERGALLAPGTQCRVCLRGYEVNQYVRKLPRCKHKFHKDCIDNWLLHSHPTCPVDGQVVWDPVTAQMEAEERPDRGNQRPSAKSKKSNSAQENNVSGLSIPGVGILRLNDESVMPDRSGGIRGRRITQQGRIQGRPAEDISQLDQLRASFTLSGTSVGATSGEGVENVATTTTLPGSRILGRLQTRKSTLSQRLSELNLNSGQQAEPDQDDAQSQSSGHFQGQKLHRKLSQRSRSFRQPSDDGTQLTQDNQAQNLHAMPLGHKNDRSTTHHVILNHLSMLQNEDSNSLSENRSDSGRSSRSQSIRSILLSRTSDIHSPVRELPPLIESDMEGNPNADIDTLSTVTSLGGSSFRSGKHQRIFERAPRLHLPTDINDSSTPVQLTSVRSTPDSRASLSGSRASANSVRSVRILTDEAQLLESGGGPGSRSQLPPMAPRLSDKEKNKKREGAEDSQPGNNGTELMERLQLFTDLYLGRDPAAVPPETNNRQQRTQLRRQLSNPTAARQRRRENSLRRHRASDFGLEGNAYSNLTLRDIIN